MIFPTTLAGTTADTLVWADPSQIEPAAIEQIQMMSRSPYARHIRIMPDVHLGKGATVGSVIAMKDAVAPTAVGVDIGCGMAAIKTSYTVNDLPDDLHSIRLAIEANVPVGHRGHESRYAPIIDRSVGLHGQLSLVQSRIDDLRMSLDSSQKSKALSQCGSLGGGNHFIELCSDDEGRIWVMLHSGSRNVGKVLAEYHISKAKMLDHNLNIENSDMAVFLSGTGEMDDYLHDLYWAQDYARVNRMIMLATVRESLQSMFPNMKFSEMIQCHHNYVAEESFNGEQLIVTRKGAIRAGSGDLGLIPGSMGTGSFVVRGLGNEASLCSASHGAGRRMSRSAARRQFTSDDLAAQTSGVECRKDSGIVDEIPAAYKNLDDVIAAQTQSHNPLVEVVTRLTTLLCVKG